MESLLQDVRLAIRTALHRPAFSGLVVAVLALGIGANAVFFSLLDSVVIQPLPFRDPDRLVYVTETRILPAGEQEASVFAADFLDWRARTTSLSSLVAVMQANVNLTDGELPERLEGAWVSSGFFEMLGVQPVLGRTFRGDPAAWERREVLISYGLWQRRFGGRPDAVGSSLRISDGRYEVVGVMPAGFQVLNDADVYLASDRDVPPPPVTVEGDYHESRDLGYFKALGRLAPGVTLEQAREEMSSVQAGIVESSYAPGDPRRGVLIEPLREELVGDVRPLLTGLLAAVAAVLLIVAANIAGLLLARAAERRREMSVRAALGASRARLLRQLLVESLFLSGVGGALGIGLAVAATGAIVSALPFDMPRVQEIGVDWRALVFVAVVSVATGILCGIAPALQLMRADLRAALTTSRGAADMSGSRRLRSLLVSAEIAVALVLVVGAGLTVKSLARVLAVDPGFDPDGVLAVRLVLPEDRYDEDAKIVGFYDGVLERMSTLPGVDRAGLALTLPFSGSAARIGYSLEGQSEQEAADQRAILQSVSAGFFRTLDIPMLAGRTFAATDRADGELVAIVSEGLVRRDFPPDRDPLEMSIHFGDGVLFRVVGVVADVRHDGYVAEIEPQLYVPMAQVPWRFVSFVLHTQGSPEALVGPAREAVRAVDPLQPVVDAYPMRHFLDRSVQGRRLTAWVLGGFAGGALLIAAIGVFGLVSTTVRQRVGEIGVRIALGADRGAVLALVLRQGLALVAYGLAAGALGGWLLQRAVTIHLDRVSLLDPAVLVGAAAVLSLAAVLATILPARRATRIDPAMALRGE